jgi:hypothetical protein
MLTKKSPEISVGRITPQVEDNCVRQIPLGTKGTFTLHVQPEHLANRFKDAILPQVLATPVMILIMENAALNAMRPFLLDNRGKKPKKAAVNGALSLVEVTHG